MPAEIPVPFWLRRISLLVGGIYANREQPDLIELQRLEDPEAFTWQVLPHAARTFAACIALMPRRTALPSAVAYLYCRMLDTYEDLVANPTERDTSLRAFAERLTTAGAVRGEAPPIAVALDRDDRDRVHLILVQRAALVDRVFASFDEPTREVIRDLVRDMAEGMCWSSATFERQGGVLVDQAQLSAYCRHVLGNPTVFGIRILRLHYGHALSLTPNEREDAMLVGEFVQLANVTRDIEKDLKRGIAYDAALKPDLGGDLSDPDLLRRCKDARERLLRMALARAGAYTRAISSIRMPNVAMARAAAVLMLLFTERYYRECARRVGMPTWKSPDSTLALVARSIPAALSENRGVNEMERAERELLWAAAS